VIGDLGGAQRSLVVRAGDLEAAAGAFVETLTNERGWDVIDTPIVSRRVGDALERALVARGAVVERTVTSSRAYADLPTSDGWEAFARARRPTVKTGGGYQAEAPLPGALDELHRLLRKEWAARGEPSPAADPQAVAFLNDVVPRLAARGLGRVGLFSTEEGEVVAADLVVADDDRRVQLLRGTDPEHAAATAELQLGALEEAVAARARRFEFAPSDVETPLRTAVGRVLRLRSWNSTAAGRVHRGVSSLRGAAQTMGLGRRPLIEHTPLHRRALDRLAGGLLEATPDVARRAIARVAAYTTLHLYRGELFARDLRGASDLEIALVPRLDFEAMEEGAREAFAARLDLQIPYCRQKWERGDLVVVARVAGRAAGILWCARAAVYVPDIGREVRPGVGECYIHDVYVHPAERGRQVAPAMLDFLARELRGRDVYRAWALIERSNTASTRAFEKAAYASVADVVYARMGLASRVFVRPPDPEARAFLGLP
jgi:ribosomal protein S18 acetylase RimI-like enzyme